MSQLILELMWFVVGRPAAMGDCWSLPPEHPCGEWDLIHQKTLMMIRLTVGENFQAGTHSNHNLNPAK